MTLIKEPRRMTEPRIDETPTRAPRRGAFTWLTWVVAVILVAAMGWLLIDTLVDDTPLVAPQLTEISQSENPEVFGLGSQSLPALWTASPAS